MGAENTGGKTVVRDIIAENNVLVLTLIEAGGRPLSLRLTRAQENTWRLQSAPDGASFDDLGAAQILARDLGEPMVNNRLSFSVVQKENEVTAEAGGQRILLTLSPFSLSLIDKARITSLRMEGSKVIAGGSLRAPAEEALYGGGERFNKSNQRGKRLEIMSVDQWSHTEGNSYAPVPLIISSCGYALFLNRYERSVLDLGAKDKRAWEFTQLGAPLDLYIFANDNPASTLRDYSQLTGYAPMPEPWLFGIQVTRHARLREFGTIEGIQAMIDKMAENDFPWDAVIAEGWDAYDADTYGDLKTITDRVHGMGKKLMLYEGCARVPFSDDEAAQKKITRNLKCLPEYFIKEQNGNYRLPDTVMYNPADAPTQRISQFLDITNPEALRWWYDFVWGRLVREIGVDGCKIDFCEQIPDHLPLVFHDGRSPSGAHHWYPTLYNALMYRYYQKYRPEGGMCFSRGGGIGVQRFPFLWAGDQLREFNFLQAILTSILSSGLSGIPFMSYDLAGYMPTKHPDENPEGAVFIRGAEMGCFSSNMQTHGIVTRPYDFDAPIKDLYRVYSKLHQVLRPYLLEQAEYACRTGMPLMRHLFLYDPRDPKALQIEDEYMLGGALLAAPVFSNTDARDIYLPRGNWRNILDNKTYRGDQTLTAFSAPFRQIPVFLLEGNDSKTIGSVLTDAQDLLGQIR